MKNLIQQGLALRELLRERILVLDGAMGTMLQQENLTAADFGGPQLEGLQRESGAHAARTWCWKIHRKYLEAGADIIETNSFGSTPIVLAEYGLGRARPRNQPSCRGTGPQSRRRIFNAVKAALCRRLHGPNDESHQRHGRRHFRRSFAKIIYEQARGLIEGGADILLLETCQDTRNIKAGVLAIQELSREIGQPIPLMISVTIEPMGTMLAGQNIEALWASLDHVDVISLGLNCATGPEFMTDHVRTLQSLTTRFVSCYPNAGLAERRGPLSGNADIAGRAARALRGSRLAEHRGRLLRHHRTTHSRDRANGGRQKAAACRPAPNHRASIPESRSSRRKRARGR